MRPTTRLRELLARRGPAYAELGVGRTTGTIPFPLRGNVRRGGLYELPFGISLRELIEDWGGGTKNGRPVGAVQVGGPLGAYLKDGELDTPLTYEALAELSAGVGHGGVVVFDDTVDLLRQAHFAFAFCAHESCGKCTPCRIGAVRGKETVETLIANRNRGGAAAGWECGVPKPGNSELAIIADLCDVMEEASLCQMGGMTPIPVRSALGLE